MKPLLQLSKIILLLMLLASAAPSASAFYEPSVSRWVSRDPLQNAEFQEGPNLYRYVLNNPIEYYDAHGQAVQVPRVIWIAAAGGGLIGIVAGALHGHMIKKACNCLKPDEELYIQTPSTKLLSLNPVGMAFITTACPTGGAFYAHVWRDDVTGECHDEYILICNSSPGA